MQRYFRNRVVAGLTLLSGACSFAANAESDYVDGYDLDEIVVTASRRPVEAFSEPYLINARDAEDLVEVRQVRTIPDAMREISGVMVQKTGHGQGSPYIRGFTGMRTLFLIDGIRLNNSTFRDGPNQYWNTVDAFAVQRLELVKGPSSVLYGSDAIGGTVNAISRGFEVLGGDAARGRILLRGSSAENSSSVRPEFGFSGGNVDVFVGLSYKSYGDLRAGGTTGTQAKTGYLDRSADFKLNYSISPNRTLTAALQYVDQDDAWRVHKTIFGKSWRGTTVGDELRRSFDQERRLAYLQYNATDLSALHGGSMILSVSHHQQDEDRFRVRQGGEQDRQGTEVGTFGLWGNVDIPVSHGTWTLGLEIYRDSVDSYRNDFDASGVLERAQIQGPVADDASYVLADAFLQNRSRFGESWELVTGLRFTSSRASADSVQNPATGERMSVSDKWSRATGSLRISKRFGANERMLVFAGISQGFRAPNLSDLTRFDTARSNEIETPVTGLDSEQFTSYEIGMKYDDGDWAGQFAIFRTAIDGMIIRTPTGRVIDGNNEITKRNSGNGYVNGLEMQLRYDLTAALQLFGNLTWMKGEVDTFAVGSTVSIREPLDRQMPAQFYIGSRWQPLEASYWLEAVLSIAGKQDELSSRDRVDTDRIPAGGTPGYSYFTLRGGWRIRSDWRLSAAVENLFDENYRIHGSGLNEPGRNIVLSIFYNYQ